MAETEDHWARQASFCAATLAVTAAYVFFVVFAEGALLELARLGDGPASIPDALLDVLGITGLVGSVLGAKWYRPEHFAVRLTVAYGVCAIAAVLALEATNWWLLPVAAVVGLALGLLAVTLAAGLRAAVSKDSLGLCCGLGVGLAYALCNLPLFYRADAAQQTALAASLMLLAAGATRWLRQRSGMPSTLSDYRSPGMVVWIVIFAVLVWMDSAVFYIIQHTDYFGQSGWNSAGSLLGYATVYLVVAPLAGVALDHGWLGRLAVLAFGALAVACVLLDRDLRGFAEAEPLYMAGVALYSTALVYYPARGGKPWLTGLLYGLAGWVGSAAGIRTAQQLGRVPFFLVAAAGLVISMALLWRERWRDKVHEPLLGA